MYGGAVQNVSSYVTDLAVLTVAGSSPHGPPVSLPAVVNGDPCFGSLTELLASLSCSPTPRPALPFTKTGTEAALPESMAQPLPWDVVGPVLTETRSP